MTKVITTESSAIRFAVDNDILTVSLTGNGENAFPDFVKVHDEMRMILRSIASNRVYSATVVYDSGWEKVINCVLYEIAEVIPKGTKIELKKEKDRMKILYIGNSIFCSDRYDDECENGLIIDVEGPMDLDVYIRAADGTEIKAKKENGIAKIDGSLLSIGNYTLFAKRGEAMTDNIIRMRVGWSKNGKIASCRADYYELLDYVYKLMREYYSLSQKLSDHIDGYEVI